MFAHSVAFGLPRYAARHLADGLLLSYLLKQDEIHTC